MNIHDNIAKDVLNTEADALLECAKRIDSKFSQAVESIFSINGKLIVIGVGKSGLVGAKIAATLASTGTPSFFLHPTEAMHGDLGMIGKDDAVLAVSYSGESPELLAILPHLKRINTLIVGMSGSDSSTLALNCAVHLNIFVAKEACPLNVAPTSSTTLTMALGDALAVALMKKRSFKKEDFAFFHPGGALGKRLFVKAKDLMRSAKLPLASHETALKDAIVTMTEGKLGNLLFVENNRVIAVLSDGDLRRALLDSCFSLENKAIEYANRNPKVCNDEDILASDALELIEASKIQLLVLNNSNGQFLGVLHLHDLVEAGIK